MKCLYPEKILYYLAENADSNYPASFAQDSHPKKPWLSTAASAWYRLHCDSGAGGVGITGTNAGTITITIKDVVYGAATATTAGKLVCSAAAFIADGVGAGDFVWNMTDGTHTTVSAVDSATQLSLTADIMVSGEVFSIETGDAIASSTINLSGVDTYLELISDTGEHWTSMGYDFGYQSARRNIVITLDTGTADDVYAGVIRAGMVSRFPDPQYGLRESFVDYSIVQDLNNGGLYVRDRDIARTFSCSLLLARDREFYDFVRSVAGKIKKNPIFWWVTDLENHDWIVYAHISNPPAGDHRHYAHSLVSFDLTERI